MNVINKLNDKEFLRISIAVTLNVNIKDAIKLMRNLHVRISYNITQIEECSFQVTNAYEIYKTYLHILDFDFYQQLENFEND